jgi:hypothetical protein
MEELKESHPEINKNDMTTVTFSSNESATEEDNFIPNPPLPSEIFVHIFTFLDAKSQHFASLVSKHWNLIANDGLLWNLQLEKYTQGFLWHYLFRTTHVSSYQKYFAEIFFEPDINCNTFAETMMGTREILLERSSIMYSKKRKSIIENYFHHVDITKVSSTLVRVLDIIKKLPSGERTAILNYKFKSIQKEYKKQIAILLSHVHLIDIHLTDLMFLGKFSISCTDQLKPLLLSPANKFLSGRAITTIFSIEQHSILKKVPTVFRKFLDRLNEKELVDCAQCSSLVAANILIYPRALNLLSDDSLIKIFYGISISEFENVFNWLMNHSPMLIERLNAEFLIRLVNYREKEISIPTIDLRCSIPAIILRYSVLINRLQEDQCVKIISKGWEKTNYGAAEKMLKSKAFKDYTVKLKNPRAFLLQLNLRTMFEIDWSAKILTSEDALWVSKRNLDAAETIATNNGWLNKFSQAQLLELTTTDRDVALILLRNSDLYQRWEAKDFSVIRQKYAHLEYREDLENAIKKIKIKQTEEQIKLFIQHTMLRAVRSTVPSNQRYQSSYATTACQLGTDQPEKQQSPRIISTPRPFNSCSPTPAQKHQAKETTRQSNNSILWPAAGLLGIGLLLATGILLCATGGGALAGVPFIVSAVTFLPVSIEIVGAVCLLAGTFLSLIGLNLANEHSTKFGKTIITPAKESHKKSMAEAAPSFFTPYKKYKPVFEPIDKLSLMPDNNKIIYSDENYEDNSYSTSRFSNR